MGFNSSTKGNRTFASIVNGKFARRVTEDTQGAIKRIIVNKKDKSEKTVYELIDETVNGMIDSIEVDEAGDYGDQLKINMSDLGFNFTVTLAMSGREAKAFLCCLKNVNLKAEVILKPYNFIAKDDGKQKIGMTIYQGGVGKEFKILPYFSKENPNGLPQVPEGSDNDEFKLAMKQQEIYLKKWVKKFAADNFTEEKPKMQPNTKGYSGDETPAKDGKIYSNASSGDSSDLPFLFNPNLFKINF